VHRLIVAAIFKRQRFQQGADRRFSLRRNISAIIRAQEQLGDSFLNTSSIDIMYQ